jgi:cytochrome b561
MLRNSPNAYGLVSRLFHWWLALVIIGLFALGVWMVTLGYYDSWYQKAPHWHVGIGIVFSMLLLLRVIWHRFSPKPKALGAPRDQLLAKLGHTAMYLLLWIIVVAGYFITTADGSAVAVFDWFEIPALIKQKGLEQTAGLVHQYLAYALMAFVVIHTLAALKHHFKDKDQTMTRMWRGGAKSNR